jgi:hypothetical protein
MALKHWLALLLLTMLSCLAVAKSSDKAEEGPANPLFEQDKSKIDAQLAQNSQLQVLKHPTPSVSKATPQAQPLPSQENNDAFMVTGIKVTLAATTPGQDLRQQALQQARYQAFQTLLSRLIVEDVVPKTVLDQQIAEMVHKLLVDYEKVTSQGYKGEFTFYFDPDAVRNFLVVNNLAYAETYSKPVVILPIYTLGEDRQFLKAGNLWFMAWQKKTQENNTLVRLIVPLNTKLTADSLQGSDLTQLQTLLKQHKTDVALISEAIITPIDQRFAVKIQEKIIDRFGQIYPLQTYQLISDGQSLEGILNDATTQSAVRLAQAWKHQNLLKSPQEFTSSIVILIKNLEEWISMQNKMRHLSIIRGIQVNQISPHSVLATITYFGDLLNLAQALQAQNLKLLQDSQGLVIQCSATEDF